MFNVDIKANSVDEALRIASTINDDEALRAFVIMVGTLKPLTARARERVMTYVKDRFDEEAIKADDDDERRNKR